MYFRYTFFNSSFSFHPKIFTAYIITFIIKQSNKNIFFLKLFSNIQNNCYIRFHSSLAQHIFALSFPAMVPFFCSAIPRYLYFLTTSIFLPFHFYSALFLLLNNFFVSCPFFAGYNLNLFEYHGNHVSLCYHHVVQNFILSIVPPSSPIHIFFISSKSNRNTRKTTNKYLILTFYLSIIPLIRFITFSYISYSYFISTFIFSFPCTSITLTCLYCLKLLQVHKDKNVSSLFV